MARPRWFVRLIRAGFPHRFRLATLTRVPGLRALLDHMLFAGDDIIYLPKDDVAARAAPPTRGERDSQIPAPTGTPPTRGERDSQIPAQPSTRRLAVNEPLAHRADLVLPSAVLHHFIDLAEHHWIMDFCICRLSDGCDDYPIQLGCLFLGEAVHKINPDLGRLATTAEAHAHVETCREAGLVHLVGRNKLDTVWLGATPGEKLLTICNCCPCCCLWKMLPHVDGAISAKVTKMPGVSVAVTGACTGCKLCVRDVCFVDAIRLEPGGYKGRPRAVIDPDRCRGCGRCVVVCPVDAITLTYPGEGSVAATIGRIGPLVDLQ